MSQKLTVPSFNKHLKTKLLCGQWLPDFFIFQNRL